MKISKLAACAALTLGFLAVGTGLPLAKNLSMLNTADCKAKGGHIVKIGGKWTCVEYAGTINITRSNIKHPN